jgi:putative (di)nucleoside polyphosphate hydrolase
MSVKKFRPNVAAVIFDPAKNKVLMFRRVSIKNEEERPLSDGGQLRWNWQFPQGGVDPGENEEETLFRELEEEIGTREVSIIRSSKTRIRYHYPRKMLYILHQQPMWKPFRGQQQRWYLVKLNCHTEKISFTHEPVEFDAYQWISPRRGLKLVVPWKRKAYRKGLRSLGIL